jgi:hypothetical protein
MLRSLIVTLAHLAQRLRPHPLDYSRQPMPRMRWYS